MELSVVAIWGNLAALVVTIGLLGATLRLGRKQPTIVAATSATDTAATGSIRSEA